MRYTAAGCGSASASNSSRGSPSPSGARHAVSARRDWPSVVIDDQAAQISFVPVSKLMRFKDDVSVKVLPVAGDAAKSTLAIYSASRVGYSDMGANAKRVGALLDRLADGQNA